MEESYLTFDSYLTFFFSVGVLSLRDLKTFFVCCLLFFKLLNNIYYVFLILFVAQSIFIIQKQNKKEMIQHIWKMSNFLRVHSCFFFVWNQIEMTYVRTTWIKDCCGCWCSIVFCIEVITLLLFFQIWRKKHTQKEMNHR